MNDSTGTSLALTNGNGDEAGRILYDGFGMTLTNTLPLTLTGTLPDTPDAATGLVHLGSGRWYDPALGRPLQPNADGGPPTIPQALNRYAATPLGQPGVYQAAETNGALASFAIASGLNAVSAGSGTALSTYANQLVGDLLIRANSRILTNAGYETVFKPVMGARGGRTYYLSSLVEQIDDNIFRAVKSGQIIDLVHLESKGLVKYPNGQAFAAVDDTVWKQFLRTGGGELAANFGINVALSIPDLITPWQNPYFSNEQRLAQNFVTISGAGVSAGAAVWIGKLAVSASLGGPVTFVLVTGTGVVVWASWEYAIKPTVSWISVRIGARDPYAEYRNLMPLGDGNQWRE